MQIIKKQNCQENLFLFWLGPSFFCIQYILHTEMLSLNNTAAGTSFIISNMFYVTTKYVKMTKEILWWCSTISEFSGFIAVHCHIFFKGTVSVHGSLELCHFLLHDELCELSLYQEKQGRFGGLAIWNYLKVF